jgi:plasmid stability protein
MANVLIRDLDEQVLSRLKSAARARGRSLQGEIHDALRRASARSLAETRRLSKEWIKRLHGSAQSDSTKLIRGERDKR